MATLPDWTNYISALAAIDLSTRLNHCLIRIGRRPLKSVYVIPSDITGNVGWGIGEDRGQDQLNLNRKLGEFGMMFIARDLAAELAVRGFIGASDRESTRKRGPFRIGLGTGSTMFHLVNSFAANGLRSSTCVVPLVVGPSPETMHSAGFIAMLLQERLNSAHTDGFNVDHGIERISVVEPVSSVCQTGCLNLRLKDNYARFCKSSDGRDFADYFDWVITGVGGRGHGQNEEHEKLYKINDNHFVGDICSRFFDRMGNESAIAKASSDSIAIAAFAGLEAMCSTDGRGKRVILIGGGKKKYEAIRALMTRRQQLFNVLVTDELTVRRLLAELQDCVAKKGKA
jgi:hypothetical protein